MTSEKKKNQRSIPGCLQLYNQGGNVRTGQVIPGGSRPSGQYYRPGLGKMGHQAAQSLRPCLEEGRYPRPATYKALVLRTATQQTHKGTIMHD